jgi:hypothetical protein
LKHARILVSGDDFSLRRIVEKIKETDSQPVAAPKRPQATGARLVMVNALNSALDITGRIGKEVLLGMLERRHGLLPEDFIDKPGEFMGALRDLLGSSCGVLEVEMLRYIKQETGIAAYTIEETAYLLKKSEGPV